MKPARRKSSQRERILALIRDSGTHPTAMEVFTMLKQSHPNAGLGNVYRNLNILKEQGRLTSRDFGDGIEHFEAILKQHYHFICEKCGRVENFPLPIQHSLTKTAEPLTRNRITGHTVQFYGICEVCSLQKEDPGAE